MTYNPNVDSGYCDLKSWVQVPSAIFISIDQSTEHDDTQGAQRTARNYAQMVYTVNPSTIISGIIGIDGSGTVGVSGDMLKVIDTQAIDKLSNIETSLDSLVNNRYSKIVKVSGDYTYVMDASIGSGLSGDPIWRVSRIYDDGITVIVDWADGNDNFDNIAANFLSLSYSF